MQKIAIFLTLFALSSALPQWPYRDNMEYYGYQRNAYRSVSGEDDSVEGQGRQDLKVGGQQPPAVPLETSVVTNASPVVVETGSAKPVLNAAAEPNKAAVAPVVTQETVASTSNKQPPAFPPATPPSPPTPTEEDSEEEDSEEEADEDDVENEEEEDEEDEGRSDVKEIKTEIVKPAVAKTVTKVTKPVVKQVKPQVKPVKTQTVEALVPGYVTDEGEVLVPFDTVVNDKKDVVAVIEDPSYTKSSPPVVVMPTEPKEDRPVPKFFNPAVNRQLYYSDVPPPGSIFTFDDDQEENAVVRARADESSEENAYDEENASDESAQDDDASEEEDEKPKSPPLAYVKATSPSGEDDEADSLGIRPIARMGYVDSRYYDYYPDRSPNLFYNGNSFYVPRYGNRYDQQYNRPTPIYYYRPASSEKVKVVPLGSFDVSIEQSEDDYRAVVSPFRYYGNNRRVVPHVRPTVVRRTQVVRRPSNQRVVYGTPVVRGRGKARREAKEMKKVNKKLFKKKLVAKKQ